MLVCRSSDRLDESSDGADGDGDGDGGSMRRTMEQGQQTRIDPLRARLDMQVEMDTEACSCPVRITLGTRQEAESRRRSVGGVI